MCPNWGPCSASCCARAMGVACADTVVVDRADDDPHDMGKYLTIQVVLRVVCCWAVCASGCRAIRRMTGGRQQQQ
jgi:hypothetical protein